MPPDVPEPRAIHHMTQLGQQEHGEVPDRELGRRGRRRSRRSRRRAPAVRPGRSSAKPSAPMTGCQNPDDRQTPVPGLDDEQSPCSRRRRAGRTRSRAARRRGSVAEPGEVVVRHRRTAARSEQCGVHAGRDARATRRAARARAARTRTAGARPRARPRRAGRRRSPPCPPPRRTRAGSCARTATPGCTCPSSDPSAPPVTMIGPSAPNGPPVPMATAADVGFATAAGARCGSAACRTASIASGMPWPRMTGDHLAISATTSPPAIATRISSGPGWKCRNDGSSQPY